MIYYNGIALKSSLELILALGNFFEWNRIKL